MIKEFVPYEIALELSKLGFREQGFRYWTRDNMLNALCLENGIDRETTPNDAISGPTYHRVFEWFREDHHLYGIILPTVTMNWTFKTVTVVQSLVEVPPYKDVDGSDYSTYEEAELACLQKLIEICKNIK